MKNKNISLWQFIGFIFTAVGGTLLHFLYDWTNESIAIAPFSGVNESTWEHMKLMFFPVFIFALIQSRYFKDYKNFWCIKLSGITISLLCIPIFFYTINGAFGKTPDWLNICIFYISAAIEFFVEWWIFKKCNLKCNRPYIPFLILCFIGILFIIFTFYPPEIGLFKDPLTGAFGI